MPLLALRTSPPSVSLAEGERIARDLYGLTVSLSVLSGERDCNFRLKIADGREFVLKILAPGNAASADCLWRALEFLAETDHGLPLPRLMPTLAGAPIGRFHRDGLDHATCLVSYLPGRLLADSMPTPMILRSVGQTLARLDRALQGFFHADLGRALAWDVRRSPELAQFCHYIESATVRAAVERVCAAMRARLPGLRALRSQAIHGDLHAYNLLVNTEAGRICGILDFGDMIHAPVIVELGVAVSELLTEGLASLQSVAPLIQGFAQAQNIEALEIEMLFDIVSARHALTLVVHAWRQHQDPAGAGVLTEAAARAAASLQTMLDSDREAITASWQRAASGSEGDAGDASLRRRHRLLGAGAELFYEQPLHLVRARGVWLYDAQGRAYLDTYNNVPHVGHCHPRVVQAISRQTATLATHTRYLHASILDYAQSLTARLPGHLDACIFVNSGSEANDVAWRLAKMATGGTGALVMAHAYHGITDAVGALTPGAGEPGDPWVCALSPPAAELTADQTLSAAELGALRDNVDAAIALLCARNFAPAAFFIDSALTSSGILDPPAAWARLIEERVRAAGALVVADEVQYGLGRSGTDFWGFERRGFTPDIVTMGKPMGNGYPMGAVIANRALIEQFQAKFGFFSTFGGNAVAASAGLAVLEVLDQEALSEHARLTGQYLKVQLQSLAARHASFGRAQGVGLLQGLTVLAADQTAARRKAKSIVNTLASKYAVLIGTEGPYGNVLKLRPPLPFGREHVDLLIQALDAAASDN